MPTSSVPLIGHEKAVVSVSFSPDGKTVASGSVDKTIKFWHETELLKTIFDEQGVWCVRYSSVDNNLLVSSSLDSTIKFWKVDTGELLRTISGHSKIVFDMSFSSDGQKIATASWDGTIKIWDVMTGEHLQTLPSFGKEDRLLSLEFSPDGEVVASGGYRDGSVRLWHLLTRTSTAINQQQVRVSAVRFSPDGKVLALGYDNGDVLFWRDESHFHLFKGHEQSVYGLAFSPDSQMLASVSADGTIKLWNQEGSLLKTLIAHTDEVYAISFSPLLTRFPWIVSASADSTARLWKVDLDAEFDGEGEDFELQNAEELARERAARQLNINLVQNSGIRYRFETRAIADSVREVFRSEAILRQVVFESSASCLNCQCTEMECQTGGRECCPQ